MSLCHEVCLSDIAIVVSGETSRIFALLVSWNSFSAWNVINLIRLLGLGIVVPIFLGLGPLNV
jgi:hypothetical protein